MTASALTVAPAASARPVRATDMPGRLLPFRASVPRGVETVLVIEDDPHVRELLRRTLLSLGYRTHLAGTAAEAAAAHEAHGDAITALLCDVVMPGISGPAIVAGILARSGSRAPKVLFMSGHTSHALLRDGRLRDGNAFIQKPMMRAALARKLREVLDA